MAYSQEIISRARRKLESQKTDWESRQRQHQQQVYAAIPRVREIDMLLRRNMTAAAQAVFTQGGDPRAAMEQVRQENQILQREREDLILAQFPPEYAREEPICPNCGGSGYVGSRMCSCLLELCRQEQKKELALLTCGEGRFTDFVLEYYSDAIDPKLGVSPRAVMRGNFAVCRRYGENFSPDKGNLLFVGGTGLGKTFLSACIATSATEQGYSVDYEPAGHLFQKLERNRFSPTPETAAAVSRLETCDLLIVDDLGTELPGNFVTAALYNLLNDRLLAGKPMVISTNLTMDEVAGRYSPQIASRLQGSFQRLTFVGQDIRILKNRGF